MDRATAWSRRSLDPAFALGLALGVVVVLVSGAFERRAEVLATTDFSGIWAGARALVVGADPYGPATWRATTAALGTQPPDTPVYGYPPWVALALVPLALLPFDVAAGLWAVGGLAAALVGMAMLFRAYPCPAYARVLVVFALLAAQPALTALIVGQWSFLLVGAMAAAVAGLRSGRVVVASAASLAMLAKPHLFLLAAPALALRDRRIGLIAGPVGAGIVLVAWSALPHWLAAWDRYVRPVRVADPPRAATLAALLSDVVGPAGVPLAAAVVVLAAAVVLLRFGPSSDATLAAAFPLSLAAAPYAWSYDSLLLLIPLVLAISALSPERPARALVLTVTGVTLLVLVAPALYAVAVARGRETSAALIPLAMLVALLVALWPAAAGGVRSATIP